MEIPEESKRLLFEALGTIQNNLEQEVKGLPHEDIFILRLKCITEEITLLEKRVDQYSSNHFTKDYRTLQGDFDKLKLELDGFGVDGRDDVTKMRKEQFGKIESLRKKLQSKVHEDGKRCSGCEI